MQTPRHLHLRTHTVPAHPQHHSIGEHRVSRQQIPNAGSDALPRCECIVPACTRMFFTAFIVLPYENEFPAIATRSQVDVFPQRQM
ncbi:MAG TPA: hypothetical protein VHI13_20550 [Candidatus Kapabacteria bacterium]|nr:hypothetical protein [Candidatus Kapabacteria bacterium]